MSEFQRLIDHLYRGGTHGYLWCESQPFTTPEGDEKTIKRTHWFASGNPIPSIIQSDWHIYFSVNPTCGIPKRDDRNNPRSYRARIEDICAINTLYGEIDDTTASIDDLLMPPSVVVESSPNKYHCYWLLQEPYDTTTEEARAYARRVQFAWCTALGVADTQAKDINRVLRVPGYINPKKQYGPDFPTVRVIKADFETLYQLDELATICAWAMPDEKPARTDHDPVTYSPNGHGRLAAYAAKTLEGACSDVAAQGVGGRNGMLFAKARWLGRMVEAGVMDETTVTDALSKAARANGSYADANQNPDATIANGIRAGRGDGALTESDLPDNGYAQRNGHHPPNGQLAARPVDIGAPVQVADEPDEPDELRDAMGAPESAAPPVGVPEPIERDGWYFNPHNPNQALCCAPRCLIAYGDDKKACYTYTPEGYDRDAYHERYTTWKRQEYKRKRQTQKEMLGDYGGIETIIEDIQDCGYQFALNLIDDTIECNGERFDNIAEKRLRLKMRENGYGERGGSPLFSLGAVEEAVVEMAYRNRYHPVQDYFNSLAWDGQDRISELAGKFTCIDPDIVYGDGTSAAFFHVALTRWMIGAVARVFERTQNVVLTLTGGQDMGKSNFAEWLCPLPGLFTQARVRPDDKDSDVRLITSLVWEIGELDATTRKADVSALKAFLTQEVVTVRKPYGRHDLVRQPMASFIGTVNEAFLKDYTGNRRFLAATITHIDWSYTDIDRDQLWAQAVALYRSGEAWRLLPEEKAAQSRTNQEHEIESLLEGWILKWFSFTCNPDDYMTASDIVDHLVEMQGDKRIPHNILNGTELKRTLARYGVTNEGRVKIKGKTIRPYRGIRPCYDATLPPPDGEGDSGDSGDNPQISVVTENERITMGDTDTVTTVTANKGKKLLEPTPRHTPPPEDNPVGGHENMAKTLSPLSPPHHQPHSNGLKQGDNPPGIGCHPAGEQPLLRMPDDSPEPTEHQSGAWTVKRNNSGWQVRNGRKLVAARATLREALEDANARGAGFDVDELTGGEA